MFAAVAAQIAHAQFHDRGFHRAYGQGNYELNAQSMSCILCRRFGIKQKQPDASQPPELYQSCGIEERWESLKGIQGMSRQIGRAYDNAFLADVLRSVHAFALHRHVCAVDKRRPKC